MHKRKLMEKIGPIRRGDGTALLGSSDGRKICTGDDIDKTPIVRVKFAKKEEMKGGAGLGEFKGDVAVSPSGERHQKHNRMGKGSRSAVQVLGRENGEGKRQGPGGEVENAKVLNGRGMEGNKHSRRNWESRRRKRGRSQASPVMGTSDKSLKRHKINIGGEKAGNGKGGQKKRNDK